MRVMHRSAARECARLAMPGSTRKSKVVVLLVSYTTLARLASGAAASTCLKRTDSAQRLELNQLLE